MELEDALRGAGHRITTPRSITWQVLSEADGHLSAAEIIERVARVDDGVNASSVYRTLALFGELGLVRESAIGDEGSHWEVDHGDTVIHLVCDVCAAVTHHPASVVDTLRRRLGREAAFEVAGIDVRVTGRCAACALDPQPAQLGG